MPVLDNGVLVAEMLSLCDEVTLLELECVRVTERDCELVPDRVTLLELDCVRVPERDCEQVPVDVAVPLRDGTA